MNQQKEKTTILFVNKGPQILKPLQISSKFILNWKKYLAGISFFLFLLIGIIAYLIHYNIQQYNSQVILSQKLTAMHSTVAEVDSSIVRKKLRNIDLQLSTINDF